MSYSKLLRRCWPLVVLAALCAVEPGNSQVRDDAGVVLDWQRSYWQYHLTLRPPKYSTPMKDRDLRSYARGWHIEPMQGRVHSPDAPADWMKLDFDDSRWCRDKGGPSAGSGWYDPVVRVMCLRGRFEVADPAKAGPLKLECEYIGGVVVSLNGQEVAREHLPKGPLSADVLAEAYPLEAYQWDIPVGSDGYPIPPALWKPTGDPKTERWRRLEVAVDAKLLQKGTNVLAVAFHASSYHAFAAGWHTEAMNGYKMTPWPHLLVRKLRLATPGAISAGRPVGVQVWVEDIHRRVVDRDWAEPGEQPVVRLVGGRNGSYSAQVVVGTSQPLPSLSANVGELVQVGGTGKTGVMWERHKKIATLPGKAAGLLVVDVNGDCKLDVYAACPQGDTVLSNQGEGEFQPLSGLKSASLAGVWADFDGDGRLDLASLSRRGLQIHRQTAPGQFTAVEVPLPQKVEKDAVSIHVIDNNTDGRPDLVLGIGSVPLVLQNKGDLKFEAVALTAAGDLTSSWGPAGPCIVGDFDGDGLADVVQCHVKDGLLFRGQADGTFGAGKPCGAAMGPVKTRSACVADFDGDGKLDLLLVGGDSMPRFLHNQGGTFAEVTRFTGEAGYIMQSGADFAVAGDFNNDSFMDLFVGYGEEPSQTFFNRGFRSFGFAKPLDLPDTKIADANQGQSAALWADVRGKGTEALVVALPRGDVFLCETDLGNKAAPMGIQVEISAAVKYAGLIQVHFYRGDQPLGVRTTGKGTGAAVLRISEPAEITAAWKLPGASSITRQVTVQKLHVLVIEP